MGVLDSTLLARSTCELGFTRNPRYFIKRSFTEFSDQILYADVSEHDESILLMIPGFLTLTEFRGTFGETL